MSERKGVQELSDLCERAIESVTSMADHVRSLQESAKLLQSLLQQATDVAVDGADEEGKRGMITAWRETLADIDGALAGLAKSFGGAK